HTLRDQPVKFRLDGETIVLSRKTETDYEDVFVEQPPYTLVSGQIISANRQPVAGASVRVKGTSLGTSTNESGWFSLQNVNDNAVLQISSVGYQSLEIPLLRFRSGADSEIRGVQGNLIENGGLRLRVTLESSIDSLA